MGRLISRLVILPVIAGVIFFVWFKTRSKPIEVVVTPITRGTVEETVVNTRAGTVDACRRARLSPSIGGQIASLPIREGDTVKAGDLLLEIWNEDLLAQRDIARQEAVMAAAEADCLAAEEAQRQAERAETLFKNQIGSREQTDRAVTEALSRKARCNGARAAVKMSHARTMLAEANLSRSRLLAPFAGIVANIEGELNEFVTPSPIGVQTPPVVDLIENSCFYVTAPIDEVDGAAVQVGMRTRISLDAYKGRTFSGSVRRIAPYVLDLEKQARTVDVEVAFNDSQDFAYLLAGYTADVEIILAARSDTLKVPTEAVTDDTHVFVFSEQEGKITKVAFEPGLRNWAFTEAVSGLSPGDRVVVNVDKPGLKDGIGAVAAEPEP